MSGVAVFDPPFAHDYDFPAQRTCLELLLELFMSSLVSQSVSTAQVHPRREQGTVDSLDETTPLLIVC